MHVYVVTYYLYMKNFIHTCTIQKLIVRKIIFLQVFDYENCPNYDIPNADFKIHYHYSYCIVGLKIVKVISQ